MGVPLSTGILRTNIKDMKVGDYIVCKYVAGTSGAFGAFSELGTSVATEIPVAGSATPNGVFYLVKIAKGHICADRVVQFSVTWDTLNTAKVIQGLPTGFNTIPVMTSNTAPSGVASSSGSLTSSARDAYMAFNGVTSGAEGWNTSLTTGWLQYQFPQSKTINGYRMMNWAGYPTASPKDWTFQGSNDGVNWDILDTQSNQGCTDGIWRAYSFNNTNAYTYYRINITANNGYTNLSITELQMFNQPMGVIRSLTGGVACADANGDMTTTYQSKGTFPTNNEWDKYIIKFDTKLIQSGKTLDDVFHYLPIYSWCQDTTINGTFTPISGSTVVGNNTNRMLRGTNSAGWGDFGTTPSNTNSASYGFRPVFSYDESKLI